MFSCADYAGQRPPDYDISLVETRYIPTYDHTQIFADQTQSVKSKTRYTPTYHSSMFRGDYRYTTKKPHLSKHRNKHHYNPGLGSSHVRSKQDAFYSHYGRPQYNSREKWYDPAKEDLFKEIDECGKEYHQVRKQADLSSNPVFGEQYQPRFAFVQQQGQNACPQTEEVKQQEEQIDSNNDSLDEINESSKKEKTLIEKPSQTDDYKEEEIKNNHSVKAQQSSRMVQTDKTSATKPACKKKKNKAALKVEGCPTFTVIRSRH